MPLISPLMPLSQYTLINISQNNNNNQIYIAPYGRNFRGAVLSTHVFHFNAIFPGEPGLAGCPLNSPSPSIPGLCILLGQD